MYLSIETWKDGLKESTILCKEATKTLVLDQLISSDKRMSVPTVLTDEIEHYIDRSNRWVHIYVIKFTEVYV